MRFLYGPNAKKMDPRAEAVLSKILTQCDTTGALVTSTVRTPANQARIMYENLGGPGPDKQEYIERQLRLYGDAGDQVIRVYEHQKAMGATEEAVRHAMEQKIIELGPQNVSRHCVADPERCVFDVAPSSIPDPKKKVFEGAVKHAAGVTKFIPFPADPAYHIELKLV